MSARDLSARELYTIYWFFGPIFDHFGHKTSTESPLPPPRAQDFHRFLFTFCEGNIGGSKGGYHEFGGGKIFEKIQTADRLIPSYPWGVGSVWLQNCTIAEARPVRICELLRTSAFLTPFFDVAPLSHDHSGHNIILVLNKYSAPRPTGRGAYSTACIVYKKLITHIGFLTTHRIFDPQNPEVPHLEN